MNKDINFQLRTSATNLDKTPVISLDKKYGVYSSLEEAFVKVPIEQRNIGMTISIKDDNIIKEYWWQNGISNDDIIVKKDPYDIENLNETDAYLQQQINQLHNVIFRIVEELPETGETNVRYLIRNESGQGSNLYDEYIWIDNEQRFELYAAAGDIYITNSFNFDNTDFSVVEQNNVYNVSLKQEDSAIQNGLSLFNNSSIKGLSFLNNSSKQSSIYWNNSTVYIENTYANGGIYFKTSRNVLHPNFFIKEDTIKYGIYNSRYLYSFDLSQEGFKFTGNLWYNGLPYAASNIIFNYAKTGYNNDIVGSYPYILLESAAYDGSIRSVKSRTELYTGMDNAVTIDNILNNTSPRAFYSSLIFDYEGNIQAIYGKDALMLKTTRQNDIIDNLKIGLDNNFTGSYISASTELSISVKNTQIVLDGEIITIEGPFIDLSTDEINFSGSPQINLYNSAQAKVDNIHFMSEDADVDNILFTLESSNNTNYIYRFYHIGADNLNSVEEEYKIDSKGIHYNILNSEITLNGNDLYFVNNNIIHGSFTIGEQNISDTITIYHTINDYGLLAIKDKLKFDSNKYDKLYVGSDNIILISSQTAPVSSQECILKYDATSKALYMEIPQTSLSSQIAALEQRVAALEGNPPT